MSLVLDASAALAWIFERTDSAQAAQANRLLADLAKQTVWVPSLWYTEVANALLIGERRGVVKEAQLVDYLARLSRLPIQADDSPVASRQEAVIALGRQLKLTAYDANYLELALRNGARLATFDTKLATAMREVGGEVYFF